MMFLAKTCPKAMTKEVVNTVQTVYIDVNNITVYKSEIKDEYCVAYLTDLKSYKIRSEGKNRSHQEYTPTDEDDVVKIMRNLRDVM